MNKYPYPAVYQFIINYMRQEDELPAQEYIRIVNDGGIIDNRVIDDEEYRVVKTI